MPKSIIFVDSRVTDYQSLIESFTEPAEVFVLDGASDGLAQIAAYLQGRTGIDAIHVISHGSQGAMYLGSSVLNSSNLASHQSQLASIGGALTETGDILLYGCNVAQGNVGLQFITSLAKYTGADVAASSDLTGAAALGGDWVLERTIGAMQAAAIQNNYVSGSLGSNTAPMLYTQSGKLTTAIGTKEDFGNAIVLQPDGKILVAGRSYGVAGNYDFAVVRYNSDGTLDTTFDGDGKLTTSIGVAAGPNLP